MKTSSELESLLGVNLPDDYKEFIDSTGYLALGNISTEVYGYELGWSIDKYPCVVATTKLNKEIYQLKDNEIVISEPGYDTFLTVLNTKTGIVENVNCVGIRKKVANSFFDWLAKIKAENDAAA